jgi:hypothetical protein|tara:strand:- start:53 stop:265 length:213 start_codon:yes stop_codon:yes gene_type:complete
MTMIENPGRPEVQATFLISHLKLMLIGMKHSRLSGTKMLQLASNITGHKYKRGQYIRAIADLVEFKKAYA